jgi:hypothetical protein
MVRQLRADDRQRRERPVDRPSTIKDDVGCVRFVTIRGVMIVTLVSAVNRYH